MSVLGGQFSDQMKTGRWHLTGGKFLLHLQVNAIVASGLESLAVSNG